jgi:hypothetical protein
MNFVTGIQDVTSRSLSSFWGKKEKEEEKRAIAAW